MCSRDSRRAVPQALRIGLLLMAFVVASTRADAQSALTPPRLLAPGESATGGFACSDGVDNDSDGVADYPGDAGCASPSDTTENGDGLVVISGTTSATSLIASINAQPAGPVTVRSDNTTLRTVTGNFTPPRANVSLNYLDFSGRLTLNVNGSRLVHGRVLATGNDASGQGILTNLGETGRVDDIVIDRSLLDGGNAGGGYCYETQIILYNTKRTKITNNTVQNICPQNSADHSEAFYVQDGNEDLLISGNTFTHNGSTAHIFFTCWTGGGGCQGSQRICVNNNTFNATWGNVYDIQNWINLDTSTINVEKRGTQSDVVSTFGTRNCKQCLDGIDNDGDGLIDLQDPQCADGADDSESQ